MVETKKDDTEPVGSAIGQLLDELSWSGSAIRRMRGGGIGDENVLTTEVMLALDLLPRQDFLGRVIATATGADLARQTLIETIEDAEVTVLPGDHEASRPGKPEAEPVRVQPDAVLQTASSWVLVEAKGPRSGAAFQGEQLAREYLVTLHHAGERTPLLLVVLMDPPPVRIRGRERMPLQEAITADLSSVTRLPEGASELVRLEAAVPETVAWITWQQIAKVIAETIPDPTGSPSVDASIARTRQLLLNAVRRHVGSA